jgi:hypothetical protein
MCVQDVAGNNIDVVCRSGHGIESQQQFKVHRPARGIQTAAFEYCGKARQIGYQLSRCFRAFSARTGQQKHVTVLIWILEKSNNGIGLSGGPTRGRWHVCGQFTFSRMNILDDFLPGRMIEDKSKIQLVGEEC